VPGDANRDASSDEKGADMRLSDQSGTNGSGLQIRLFSDISIKSDGVQISTPPPKLLELLCYLLIFRDQFHNREVLAEVLWRDAPAALSKKYLRQALWRLKTALERETRSESDGTQGLFILDPGWVRINPNAPLWLDVDIFERTFGALRDTPGEELTDDAAERLDQAVQLHRGDLMVASYQDWCISERERLRLARATMLEQLMSYCQHRGLYARGVAYGESILRHDPARESTHRSLMRLHHLAGSRTDALRQFERCAAAMAQEFDLAPSEDTAELHEQIRRDRLDRSRMDSRPYRPATDGADVDSLKDRLDQIQRSLSALRDLVLERTPAAQPPPPGPRDVAKDANTAWRIYPYRDPAQQVSPNGPG
jgi:DNA-binding SARP family transcriptional activator